MRRPLRSLRFIELCLALSVVGSGGLATTSSGQPRIIIDHNSNAEVNAAFKFKRIPSPSKDDAASSAKLIVVDGDVDPNSADITALVDGVLPGSDDDPRKNFFFNAGTGGGRWRMDLGSVTEIAQINTYSWHPNSRGPQVYRVWGSDGAAEKFNSEPKARIDPATCGWQLIATVDTRVDEEEGGQYGVNISSEAGTLGKFRFLLFDFYVAETADNFGNTFYSEVDVIAAAPRSPSRPHF